MQSIDIADYRRIVILTGAGVSVASGIRPFRGPDGVWNEISGEQLNADAAKNDPALIWQVFGPMREVVRNAEPNAAHRALACLESGLASSQRLTLVTQNIDGLHQRAGNKDVIELHGALLSSRCSNADCESAAYVDRDSYDDRVPSCGSCGSHLLPDVVLFGEPIPAEAEWKCKRALRDCDLFLAVGTSGTVSPASNFVRSAEYAGARTVLVNLEPQVEANPYFQEEINGRAEEVLPVLLM